jgi:nucleoside-diphosphate-sugar epimerase
MKIFITGGSGFIGSNAVPAFTSYGHTVLNHSLDRPLDITQVPFWRKGDLLDRDDLVNALVEFSPDWVVHLAARAECDENTTVEEGYRVNTVGTQNLLDAIGQTASVQRVIITSSQFVCGPGRPPEHDQDYFPETVYGQSKVITEQLTRRANLPCCWTIIRPTNIWGPWHLRYRREFWRVLQRGLYVHPGRKPVVRSYGYVKNVVDQMRRIFESPAHKVHERTLYLGDPPADIRYWVDGFSCALAGRSARTVPRSVLRALALAGDIPTRITGRPFLINSSRYRSLITDYNTPMEETFELLGLNPFSLEDGIKETVEWLRSSDEREGSGGGA